MGLKLEHFTMALIYETKNFTVEVKAPVFVSREEGGHIRIIAKRKVTDRTKLTPKEAVEFMRLTILVGEAMEQGLKKRGINIIKINYEDLGNWAFKRGEKPQFHMQIFGRTADAKIQKFPDAVYLPDLSTGFYDEFKPLNKADIEAIQKELAKLETEEKYQLKSWGL